MKNWSKTIDVDVSARKWEIRPCYCCCRFICWDSAFGMTGVVPGIIVDICHVQG